VAESGTPTFYPVILEEVRREHGDVCTYAFRPEQPLAFQAGQHVHLSAPGVEVSKPMVRHMSVASAPGDPLLQFSMDLSSHSDYKEAFRRAQPGQTSQIFKIGGAFTVEPGEAQPLVFIAGGIGITPFRALIRHLEQTGRPRAWTLLHVSRDAFLYQEELSCLPFPQVRVGRPQVEGQLERLVAESPLARYYLCGSKNFLEGLYRAIQALGIPEGHIKTEDFR